MDIAEKSLQLKKDFDDCYEAGKTKEWSDFWDSYQSTNYIGQSMLFAFAGGGWNTRTFKPKHPIMSKYTSSIFQNNTMAIDLAAYCEENNIILDFSNTTTWSQQFAYSSFSRVGVIDVRGGTYGSLAGVFNSARNLKTIDKLILKEDGTNSFSATFYECVALANIVIEGTIGRNIDFSYCPLTKDSILSVVEHLSDTEANRTVTFKKTAKESAFTEDEWATLIATKPNWTFSLA